MFCLFSVTSAVIQSKYDVFIHTRMSCDEDVSYGDRIRSFKLKHVI